MSNDLGLVIFELDNLEKNRKFSITNNHKIFLG